MKVTDEMVRAFVESLPPVYAFDAPPPSAVREGIAAALRAQPSEPQGVPDGSWLWCKLMDFCKKRRLAPAEYNDLFAIVTEAHKLNTAPAGNAGGDTPQPDEPVAVDGELPGMWERAVASSEGEG